MDTKPLSEARYYRVLQSTWRNSDPTCRKRVKNGAQVVRNVLVKGSVLGHLQHLPFNLRFSGRGDQQIGGGSLARRASLVPSPQGRQSTIVQLPLALCRTPAKVFLQKAEEAAERQKYTIFHQQPPGTPTDNSRHAQFYQDLQAPQSKPPLCAPHSSFQQKAEYLFCLLQNGNRTATYHFCRG